MNDLESMSLLSKQGNKNLKMFPEIIEAKIVKAGGKITFGVDQETAQSVMREIIDKGTHYVVCYAIPKDAFNEVKKLDYQTEVAKLQK